MEILRSQNINELIDHAAYSLNSLFSDNFDKPILFLTSGGSAFSLLDKIDTAIFAPNFTITVLDERGYVNPEVNNFSQLTQTDFYKACRSQGCKFIDTRLGNQTLKGLSLKLDLELKRWRKKNQNGLIIATLGVGPDGHTSGIMPFPSNQVLFSNLFCSEAWVRFYDAEDKNEFPFRITTTITFLKNQVDFGIVYAVGENKQNAITNILAEEGTLAVTPARVIREMREVMLYTDRQT